MKTSSKNRRKAPPRTRTGRADIVWRSRVATSAFDPHIARSFQEGYLMNNHDHMPDDIDDTDDPRDGFGPHDFDPRAAHADRGPFDPSGHDPRGHHRGHGRGFDPRHGAGFPDMRAFARDAGFGPGFGPRRARRGDVRGAVLSLLAEEPLNGYQLIKRIARNTGGMWRPSSGSVYPTLAQLTTDGLIESVGDGQRTQYRLTDAGRTYVGEHAAELAEAWNTGDDISDETIALTEALAKVAAAARQLAQHASPDQSQRAVEVLDEARRKLYQLLAE